jgi:hypothetical protein
MDPFVATIVKKSALVAGGFLLAGIVVALIYGMTQYSNLQHTMTLKMVPGQLSQARMRCSVPRVLKITARRSGNRRCSYRLRARSFRSCQRARASAEGARNFRRSAVVFRP